MQLGFHDCHKMITIYFFLKIIPFCYLNMIKVENAEFY